MPDPKRIEGEAFHVDSTIINPASEAWVTDAARPGIPAVDLTSNNQYGIKLKDIKWQRSSVVEQGTHKPLVSGPNPLVATYCYINYFYP